MASDIPMPPPLKLRTRRGAVRTLASTRWVVAVAAAIAVLAIVAGALAVAGALPGRPTRPAGPIETNVPPYYVALLASQPSPQHYPVALRAAVATVRATSTGAELGNVTAPKPYSFVSVTAAADDRTFVLLAAGPSTLEQTAEGYPSYAQRFFLLHINPTSPAPAARAQLTALPRAGIASELYVQAMALSPTGRSLAVIFTDPKRSIATNTPGQLTVFNLTNGTRRTWIRTFCAYGRCARGPIGLGSIAQDPSELQLSWTSDGRSLLFLSGPAGSQLRLLDLDAPGRELIADSRALPLRTAYPLWTDAVVTPDGKSVFIHYSTSIGSADRSFLLRVSVTTGKTAFMHQILVHPANAQLDEYLLWTNNDGSKFIVFRAEFPYPYEVTPSGQTAAIYSGRRFTPIPWPAGVIDAAW
jgi:hypothetical protein